VTRSGWQPVIAAEAGLRKQLSKDGRSTRKIQVVVETASGKVVQKPSYGSGQVPYFNFVTEQTKSSILNLDSKEIP